MIKNILFDFGGTLDTNGIHWSEKFWEVYKEFNVPLLKSDFEAAFVSSNIKIKELIDTNDDLKSTLRKEVECQFDFLLQNEFLENAGTNHLIEEIVEKCVHDAKSEIIKSRKLLNTLRKNYKIGIVSNYHGNLKTVLRSEGLDEVDVIIDSEVEQIFKPDPKIFQLAIKRLQAKPSETVVIGDSYSRDIDPAKKLGCTTVWLDVKSYTKPKDTSDADYTVKSLYDIEKIIDKINNKKY
ncbi:MAG: hypothetical protein COZ80_05535 [Ignavibacteria bacterium CG_4_8_14_3_um_filter_37_9]|nr:MAG: hypothetical protein COZ80_05535 [Ignavibacteria bacterium CG_4_8_14_3_um_filter_37_9]